MNITAQLTDSFGTIELPVIEVPLTTNREELTVDVVTLGNDMYTDFSPTRRKSWVFPYDNLTEDIYDELEAKYDAQFTTFQYPTITIDHYGIEDVPVRMFLNAREVWNDCGSVQNIQLSFRETSQLPVESS